MALETTRRKPSRYNNDEPKINRGPIEGRVPPQNLDAEISTLGALLLDTDAIMKVVDILRADDFYRPDHGQIYAAMVGLFEKRTPIDLVTVAGELERIKALDELGGMAKLSALVSSVATAANITYYATIIREKALLRRLIAASSNIGELGWQEELEVDELLDTAERTLFAVTQRFLKQNFISVRTILDDSFERLGMLANGDGGLRGIPTGFRQLDRLLGGLQRSDLLIIAARPSMGKCVVEGTKILDPITGLQHPIEELVAKKKGNVATLTQDWKLEPAKPSHFIDNGEKPVFQVTTTLGKEVTTTAVHPFLTVGGWKRLEELVPGDRIAVPRTLPFFGTNHMAHHEVSLAAYFIADGGLTQTSPKFTNTNPIIVRDFLAQVQQYEDMHVRIDKGTGMAPSYVVCKTKEYGAQERKSWHQAFLSLFKTEYAQLKLALQSAGMAKTNLYQWQGGNQPSMATALRVQQFLPIFPLPTVTEENPVTGLLRDLGLWGKDASQKTVPQSFFALEKSQVALFLNRLFACDGTAYVAQSAGRDFPVIAYSSISKRLIQDVQHLLLRFGIISKIRTKKVAYKGGRNTAYELEIHGRDDLNRFANEIGILGKEIALAKVVTATSKVKDGYTKDTIPQEIWQRILAVKGSRTWRSMYTEMGLPESHNIHAGKRAPRRETLGKLAETLQDEDLYQLANSDVYWDTIKTIEPLGLKHVYDLTIPETHNFIADDFVVHNTAFVMNIAEHVAVQEKKTVGIFSLEMSKEQLVDRLISSMGRVDSWKLRNGQLSEDDMSSLIQAQAQLAEANLFIDDAPMASVMEVRAKARRLQAEHGLDLICIDYLQLMQGSAKHQDNRVQEVSEISRSLKALAKELNCPVIALSQLSRAVEARNDKRPMLSDLRESGSIEQDADVVMFLYREDYYNKNREEHSNLLEVIISKHRNGPTGDAKLSAQLQHSRFYDIDLRHD